MLTTSQDQRQTIRVPAGELVPHPQSFVDPSGRLYQWNGDLYRGVTTKRADLYRELVSQGTLRPLFDAGLLVHTEIAPVELEGYPLVLKHYRVPFVSYAYEWPAVMLKAVACLVLDLESELATRGLTLADVHPWNVLFDGPRPVYVDFGSIWPTTEPTGWRAYDEFVRFYLNPLLMMERGQTRLARWLLHDHLQGVLSSDVRLLDPTRELKQLLRKSVMHFARRAAPEAVRRVVRRRLNDPAARLGGPSRGTPPRAAILSGLRRQLEPLATRGLGVPNAATDNDVPSLLPSPRWTAKHTSVFDMLSEAKPASVLDVGSGRGWYARLAASLGSKVVAFDADEAAATGLFRAAQASRLPLVPLVMDFRSPSPGYGVANEWLAPAAERLACELVLALGLVEELVLRQELPFAQVVRGLAAFCKRWLLVEFSPAGDDHLRGGGASAPPGWYSLEAFIRALRQQFREIRVLPSHPEPRVLVLCEK
jgi:SAM-dependent methyltransferase